MKKMYPALIKNPRIGWPKELVGLITHRVVTSQRGSWKWQDPLRIATYKTVLSKDGRILWKSINISPKMSKPHVRKYYPLMKSGSLHNREYKDGDEFENIEPNPGVKWHKEDESIKRGITPPIYYLGVSKDIPHFGEIITYGKTPTRETFPQFKNMVGPWSNIKELAQYASKIGVRIINPVTDQTRFAKLIGKPVNKWKSGDMKKYMDWKENRYKRGENPPSRDVVIYDEIQSIEAKKGKNSLWPKTDFRHSFKSKSAAQVIGRPDGSLVIKSKTGKPLWKNFNYPERKRK